MSDFFDGIEGALDERKKADDEQSDAPRFDPKEGDELKGVFLKAEPFTGNRGFPPTVLFSFRNVGDEAVGGVDAGASGVMFAPTVLKRKLLEAIPAMGTPFALRYEGKIKPEGGGNPYNDYTLLTSYEKTGEDADRDQELWTTIARVVVVDDAPRKAQGGGNAATDDGWKF